MKNLAGGLSCLTILAAALALTPTASLAEQEIVEEVITTGTRSVKPRSVVDSPVPVDVIGGDDFRALGNAADLTDNLKTLVPSYTATPATGDGSAFVRPTSLRGTAPDQVLVLVDGKRRHRSALLHFFAPAAGNGAHGVDVGMLPGIALKRVEVLRDGASSQYGSDAIAGVINFITRDADSGGEVQVQYGQHYEGEESVKFAANAGFAPAEASFVNLSLEYLDNEALSRGIQRPDAQALIDGGAVGVGADAPFGDAPLVQTWGRPETSGLRFFLNSGIALSDDAELYGRLGYADTEGRYRFFYRNPSHPTIVTLSMDPDFLGLPVGYTPFLDGDQTDTSLVIGVNGEFANDMRYDFSIGYGMNELDYFLNNTTNPSLDVPAGGALKRNFDVGGYEQEELNLNADFSKALSDELNIAFGLEWREETYTAVAGEPDSYFGSGSNGFGGIKPQDAGEFDRDNFAVYGDLEQDVSDAFMMQYALRFEDYSDFGSTVNGKIASRFTASDMVTLRGAVSTGFHAPTPGQINVRTTITTFDGMTGMQVEEGLVPSTDPRVAEVGGKALKEEESLNLSAGVTVDIGTSSTLTVDVYRIDVDDRIYRTGDIAVPGTTNATISFYTNALDIEHTGMDVVLTSDLSWGDSLASTSLTFAYSYNDTNVVGQSPVGGVNPVSDSLIEDIENNYPYHRFVLTTNTQFNEQWNLMVRGNYYGEHYDERGRIGAATAPSFEMDPTFYVDAELGFQINDNWRVKLGGVNIFDSFIDEIGEPFSNRLSVGLQYPRRSAANYEGGSWYLGASYSYD